MRRSLVAIPLIITSLVTARSQESRGEFARIVVLRSREGMQAQFEAGYKRHLEWHRQNNDSWTWLGWTFVLGEHAGWFIDGSFGHAPDELDRAVAPAADAADNAANVLPYAEIFSHGLYRHVAGTVEPPSSLFLEMSTVAVRPGHELPFESFVRGLASLSAYRLVAGGRSPSYLVFRPRGSWAELARSAPLLATMDPKVLEATVANLSVEVLRYRTDMSYRPVSHTRP